MIDPISRIKWLKTDYLNANWWNPNRVHKLEFELLKHSLLSTGWIQPILVNVNFMIIDGYHRWRLSCDDPDVRERWGGKVPCAILDVDDTEAKVITVRINRAKGTHIAVGMSDLVKQLVNDEGCDPDWVAAQIGADRHEVDVLLAESVFDIKDIQNWQYSNAWYPEKVEDDA